VFWTSHCSSGSIVSDYRLDDRCSIPDRGRGFFFQFLHPDRLWGPPSLLSLGVKHGRGVMLTTYSHLVPRLRISRSYTSSPPICLHGTERDNFTLQCVLLVTQRKVVDQLWVRKQQIKWKCETLEVLVGECTSTLSCRFTKISLIGSRVGELVDVTHMHGLLGHLN
jgi:hypothetical protein